ncbi:polysaccharide pyruvyl transferase family protein [Novosphingobium album (ex Liu et al. 2023)]|uniref:Polysaccharide pyruvyl transferase family protein n=1 Tax=Novosphingobium album (ex Liu et al. 2023) TaxID=3031130 RepID=A0ABT5WK87_9SPHN|nr:polysaccharide pyruvyl transferase family protein [Novosphingobium album (ex Liu et al. 2023)]MDE8650464.1 polysaccharide pyruvyl transferase family protein [Novosphingobium album (ex Liu et al. 2023)]
MSKIFVSIAGQHDNLGDVVLHRSMLKALRGLGKLHIVSHTLDAPYVGAVVDGERDDVQTDAEAWNSALRSALGRERILYFQKPGELVLTGRRLGRDLLHSLTLRRIARRGGASFVLGVGARSPANPWRRLALRLAFAPYALVGWRDVRTAREMKIGQVMPDWAFGDGTPGAEQGDGPRDQLVVSLRIDRPEPSEEWLEALRLFAQRRELGIAVVCQVARDMPRCEMLAARLGGTLAPWVEGDFVATEDALRALYRRTAMAVSDRLHVLIIAATEGAVPLCLLDREEEKIGRHFDAIGFPGSAQTASGPDVEARVALLERQFARRVELVAACDKAREAVRAVEREVARIAGA